MRKLLGILITIGVTNTFAADIAIKQGVDYNVITPPATAIPISNKKVNVTEFYSYACIHCAILEPQLDKWYASAKNNVDLNRIQVVWESRYANYAKINATVQLLNLSSEFNQAIFNAVKSGQNLEDPSQLQTFLEANKNLVNIDKFNTTYKSFSISSKPNEYANYTKAYNITGTPTFVIDGKYVTTPARPEKLIQVIQALVDKAQQDRDKNKNNNINNKK